MFSPRSTEGLSNEERATRAADIKRYVALYKQLPALLAETDYPALARTVLGWQALPAADRSRLLDLLAVHLSNYDKLGLKNNTELMALYRRQTKGEKPFNGPKATK